MVVVDRHARRLPRGSRGQGRRGGCRRPADPNDHHQLSSSRPGRSGGCRGGGGPARAVHHHAHRHACRRPSKAVVVSQVTAADAVESTEWETVGELGLPAFEDCVPITPPPGVGHFDHGVALLDPTDLPFSHGPRARVAGYMRPIESRAIDAAWLAMALDWFPPASFSRIDPPAGGISVSYTVHVHRTMDELARRSVARWPVPCRHQRGRDRVGEGADHGSIRTHPRRVVSHPLDSGTRSVGGPLAARSCGDDHCGGRSDRGRSDHRHSRRRRCRVEGPARCSSRARHGRLRDRGWDDADVAARGDGFPRTLSERSRDRCDAGRRRCGCERPLHRPAHRDAAALGGQHRRRCGAWTHCSMPAPTSRPAVR